jgi:hypothetical protein
MDNAIVCIRTGVVEAVAARDVSDALRIAVSTVGRPLADGPQIRSETKAGVQNAALRLVYMGSTPAQEIRGGSSKLVGLVIPDLQNDFYATIAQALSHCCDAEEYHLALSITDDNRDIEARRIRELVSARVAGIIIVPTASPRKETVVVLAGVPHVQLLRRIESLDADWFGMNDEECLLEGTQHLLELGHRPSRMSGARSLCPRAPLACVASVARFRRLVWALTKSWRYSGRRRSNSASPQLAEHFQPPVRQPRSSLHPSRSQRASWMPLDLEWGLCRSECRSSALEIHPGPSGGTAA